MIFSPRKTRYIQCVYDVDITIVGAGVIGLSIAMQVSRYGEVFVLEQEGSSGRGISSRNSEVIHAGIYFPPAFLKTRLCVDGLLPKCQTPRNAKERNASLRSE
jgi:glycine/D-amino acid oxidase-like deaminating enzyme